MYPIAERLPFVLLKYPPAQSIAKKQAEVVGPEVPEEAEALYREAFSNGLNHVKPS